MTNGETRGEETRLYLLEQAEKGNYMCMFKKELKKRDNKIRQQTRLATLKEVEKRIRIEFNILRRRFKKVPLKVYVTLDDIEDYFEAKIKEAEK